MKTKKKRRKKTDTKRRAEKLLRDMPRMDMMNSKDDIEKFIKLFLVGDLKMRTS